MVVWVSGASSGLGLHTALRLQAAGMTVVCGARSFRSEQGPSEGGYRLYLDVKDAGSIKAFSEQAYQLYGPPDALCCCAGVLTLGACEEYDLNELRDVMETNFLGQAAMLSAALPMMRKNGHGKIILFSSINGILGVPFQGAYTASKHAVEGYAECLRMEVKRHGIQVCVVEPGDHKSGAQTYRRHAANANAASPYQNDYLATAKKIEHDETNGQDPDVLGEKIAQALQKKRLPCKMIIASFDQRLAVWLHKLLPARLFSRIIASYYY